MNLNIGSGADKREGWTSLDANPKYEPDLVWDVRQGPLPVAEGEAQVVHMEMLLSSLTPVEGQKLLRDCRRVLAPGGIIRVAEADFDREYNTWEDESAQDRWYPSWSRAMRLNAWFKRYGWACVYDRPALVAQLRVAGFDKIVEVAAGHSKHPELDGLEHRPGGLVYEAVSPGPMEGNALDLLRAAIPIDPHGLLDVGCGSTYHSLSLSLSSRIVGIDVDPRGILISRGHGLDARLLDMRAMLAAFGPSAFEVVMLKDSLEHVSWEDAPEVVRQAKEVAGSLVVAWIPLGDYGDGLQDVGPFKHKHHWTLKQVESFFPSVQHIPGYGGPGKDVALATWRRP